MTDDRFYFTQLNMAQAMNHHHHYHHHHLSLQGLL